MVAYELVLRGIAIGSLVSAAVGIWRVAHGKPVGIAGLLLCVAAIGHVLESSRAFSDQGGIVYFAINLLSLGATGFIWLFVVTLFEDRSIKLATLAPVAGLLALGLAAYVSGLRPIWLAQKLCEASLALHALSIVFRTWRGDLVEARLRIRTPFVAIVALYALLMAGLQIAGLELPARDLINGAALAALGIAGAAIFLRGPADLLGVTSQQPQATPASAADQAALDRLNRAMDADQVWRREGLTIGALADLIGLPEHRLRRLINDRLGFRNFAAFINARRIEAAKRMLTDPEQARTTVAAIAFDLGFGSLGPFNRAFKEATGLTPTEFRRTQGSPNPEISR
ncbi:MAG: hypothetical protein A4S17_06585 [Proteobacteria bacterium HN_bin10]|nr:MAG: hypothetical protein A4S17_06585 [Proteobacteria bacterium HN_bin10]